jgi:DNA-directed RNA polymerase specialized sigma24 family protein
MNAMTDGDLVRQTLAGTTAAYGTQAGRWSARVLAVCHARVGRDAAEDLAQEALLRGLRALPTLTDPEKFGPWLIGIAARTSLDWLKSARRTEVSLDALGAEDEFAGAAAGRAAEDNAAGDRREQTERLMAAQYRDRSEIHRRPHGAGQGRPTQFRAAAQRVADSCVGRRHSDHRLRHRRRPGRGIRRDLPGSERSRRNRAARQRQNSGNVPNTLIQSGQTFHAPFGSAPYRCTTLADQMPSAPWQDELLLLKPANDPEVAARVDQLMSRIASAVPLPDPPCPVERDLRAAGQAWCSPMACYLRAPPRTIDPSNRRAAARLLADLAPPSVVPDLIELLADEDGQVRSHAAAALQRLTGQTLGYSPDQCAARANPAACAAWREWWGWAAKK